jgi:hypothetical protein
MSCPIGGRYRNQNGNNSFGIGLIAALDVAALTVETINNFVDVFLTQEKRPWKRRQMVFDRSILDKTHKMESNRISGRSADKDA